MLFSLNDEKAEILIIQFSPCENSKRTYPKDISNLLLQASLKLAVCNVSAKVHNL